MDNTDIKKLVNQVFTQKGMPKIKSNEFASKFADGCK